MTAIRKLYSWLYSGCWNLGFIEQPLSEIIEDCPLKIHYLNHSYKDRWFADPWLLKVDKSNLEVLVEEYRYSEKIGYISKLTVDRMNYHLLNRETLLKLNSHLSFPAILRRSPKAYIYPENSNGEGLGLYEINTDGGCTHVRNLCSERLTDAVITDLFGDELLFSTHLPTQNGNTLYVYRIDIETGETLLIDEYRFESNIARNAGEWFRVGEKVYRPAQDCNGGYGMAVFLQEVERKEDGSFEFHDVRRLTSTHPRYNTGLHTFNHLNGLSVIDVHGYRFPKWVAKSSKIVFDLLLAISGKKR